MTAAPHLLRGYETLVAQRAAKGTTVPSEWWQRETRRFLLHETAKRWIRCIGRGGAKTDNAVDLGIVETFFGEHRVPRGERHYFVHVSENLPEAQKTLRLYEQRLELLGTTYTRSGDVIELHGVPRGIRVLACRVGAVSGYRCIGWSADECAKWTIEGVEPADEIIASLNAMTVTHPEARGYESSSPMGEGGHFYETFIRGDTERQVVSHAPSWIANPGAISEERTRELEPHEPTRLREYGAVPGFGEGCPFDPVDARAMVRHLAPGTSIVAAGVRLVDTSMGRCDGWADCASHVVDEPSTEPACIDYVRPDGSTILLPNPDRQPPQRRLYVHDLHCVEGRFGADVTFAQIVAATAERAQLSDCPRAIADQFQSYALRSGLEPYGIDLHELPWTQATKAEAVATLRRLMRDRSIVVEPGPEADALVSELLGMRERQLPSGGLTVVARRTAAGHADRASLLLLLARAESDGLLWGSPAAAAGGVLTWDSYTNESVWCP